MDREDEVAYETHSRVSPFIRQSVAVSGVVLYMIGTGANIAFPGVLLEQLRRPDSVLPLTPEHESWIASILGLALITGICAAPFCLQHFGRKTTNQLSSLPALAGWALLVAARGPAALLASRSLQGDWWQICNTEGGHSVLDSHHNYVIKVASILGLALITGICAAPFCLQHFGRKTSNQLSSLPALAGWALLVAARGPAALLASRSLQGFGMGLQAAAAPVSIAEYSDPTLRGAFLATIAFSFATGMLVAHVFGTLLYWRTAAVACGSVYVLSLVMVSLSPETPPYLASIGLYAQCRKSFRWLRGIDTSSEKELQTLLNTQKNKVDEGSAKLPRWKIYRDTIKKPEFYNPTLIMIFMFVLFQVSGMTVVPSYTVPMMAEVTGGAIEANTSMLIVDVVRFLTAILACVVVNKLPRRIVLFLGIYITVFSLFLTALLLYLRDLGYIPEEYKWTPVIPTLTYIFGKTLGILPIPWAIAGEVFPLAYRSLGSGISGMILSIMFFIVVKTAPASFEMIGINGTFCVYAICVAICGAFLFFILPETKGKTLYEIECHFRGEEVKNVIENERMLELKNLEGG